MHFPTIYYLHWYTYQMSDSHIQIRTKRREELNQAKDGNDYITNLKK